jgi:hypothetical protein
MTLQRDCGFGRAATRNHLDCTLKAGSRVARAALRSVNQRDRLDHEVAATLLQPQEHVRVANRRGGGRERLGRERLLADIVLERIRRGDGWNRLPRRAQREGDVCRNLGGAVGGAAHTSRCGSAIECQSIRQAAGGQQAGRK